MKKISTWFILIVLVGGCSCPKKKMVVNANTDTERMDSASVDHQLYSGFRELAMLLGISNLDTGFDGLQYRFWFGYSTSSADSSSLLIFSKVRNEWHGELYNFSPVYDSVNMISLNKSVRALIPKSGWEVFEDKISSANMVDFRKYRDISGYPKGISTHCDAITVEMGSKNFHKVLKYPCYEFSDSSIRELNIIADLIRYMETNFSIKLGNT